MKKLDFTRCKKNLVILWLSWAAGIFLLLFVQSFGDGEGTRATWEWCVPLLAPNALLMVGVMVADAQKEQQVGQKVDSFIYWLTFWLSTFYLVLVVVSIVYYELVEGANLKDSTLWLSSVQGLVNLVLGVFFVKTEGKKA
ncbi:MAG: hypothetical protein PHE17_12055 [Thiothrix sp.]|uniref:hypothetical protein n=1 Tax=Thiothrix sp. TaxID=1032 RepID=UPI002621C915|nr:hypothetical protein [Thiothrix sp.]MDD5393743.1 hypothetical protein [Thiothrix sp.]